MTTKIHVKEVKIDNPTNSSTNHYAREGCRDSVRIDLVIEKNTIKDMGFLARGCMNIIEAAETARKELKGRDVSSIYSYSPDVENEKKHAFKTVINALKSALVEDPLEDIMSTLDKYDEGAPPRSFGEED